jgi:membrane-associated phospholipid phosphatase
MNPSVPGPAPLPPTAPGSSFWSAHQRRPAFLFLLVTGLVVFLVWLPGSARASLGSALSTHWGVVLLLSLFALLALSFLWSAGQRLDTWFFSLINMRVHPKWLDLSMWLATQFGNMVAALIAALLLFLLTYHNLAFEVIFGTFALWLLVETIKVLTDRARPFLDLAGTRVIGWREPGRSFPSGHTAQIFFLATLLSRRLPLGLPAALALYAVAALVGFTRIYVGAHYPRDVIGGAVLGSVWGILATIVDPYWFGSRF